MEILITLIAASFIFILQHLSFGYMVTSRLLALRFGKSLFTQGEKLLLGVFVSFALHAGVFFLGGHLVGPAIYYAGLVSLLIGLVGIRGLVAPFKQVLVHLRGNLAASILGAAAVLSLYSTIAFSWIKKGGDLYIQAGQLHDSAWHIALIKKLVVAIPPEHPSAFQETVTNYHYFYDLIIAGFNKVFMLPVEPLYFQFMPLLLSLLLAGSVFLLARRLGGALTGIYAVFLTFFAGSFAYFLPLIFPGSTWHESSFWVSQTFAMMINPQIIYTLALSAIALLLMHQELKKKALSLPLHLLLILLIATSLGFKSYSFVILGGLYGFLLLLKLNQIQNIKVFGYGILFLLISLPFLWLIVGMGGGNGFIYEPLWYVNTMIESPDRVNHLEWKFMEDHYILKENWLRVWEIKIKEIALFFAGNLGLRILMLGMIPLLFLKKIKVQKIHAVLAVGFLFTTIFPLLYLQRGIVWNSIQFWYYGLIFANIMAAIVLSWIHRKLVGPSLWDKAWLGVFIVILAVLALPTYFQTMKIKLTQPEIISEQELSILEQIDSSNTVLTAPSSNKYFGTSLVSAYTEAHMVFANPVQLELLGFDVREKEDQLNKDLKGTEIFNEFENLIVLSPYEIESPSLDLKDQVETDLYLYLVK